jgi:hypothetical protein
MPADWGRHPGVSGSGRRPRVENQRLARAAIDVALRHLLIEND